MKPTEEQVDVAAVAYENAIKRMREKHDSNLYRSAFESYGIIAEEFNKELLDAIHQNDPDQIGKELLDVATASFWAYLSFMIQIGKI